MKEILEMKNKKESNRNKKEDIGDSDSEAEFELINFFN